MSQMEAITDIFPMGIPKEKTKKSKKDKVENMSKDQFKRAKEEHKNEIAKLKSQRAQAKRDIKMHRLLIRQARIMYKVTKVKGSK